VIWVMSLPFKKSILSHQAIKLKCSNLGADARKVVKCTF